MTSVFWLLIAAMLCVAVLLLAIPLWRQRQGEDTVAPVDDNLRWYERRQRELAQERALGQLDEAAFKQAQTELDRQLLNDVREPAAPAVPHSARATAIAVVVLLPALALGTYLYLNPDLQSRLTQTQAKDISAAQRTELAQLVEALTRRIQQKPDDGMAWLLLGRGQLVLGKTEQALASLREARRLLGDDPRVLTDYAEALAQRNNGLTLAGEPQQLLDQALAKAPDYGKALWLGGLAAAGAGKYDLAIERWRHLLQQMPDNSEMAGLIRENIAIAQTRLGAVPPAAAQAPVASGQAGAAKLMVKVSLLPDLRGRLTAQDSLFVYAQAPQGPPMPLAVVRKPASELPLTVQLDDSQAMLPNHRLSNYDQVMITARISHSGQATPQPGDLIGRVGPLETRRTAPIELVIDSVSR